MYLQISATSAVAFERPVQICVASGKCHSHVIFTAKFVPFLFIYVQQPHKGLLAKICCNKWYKSVVFLYGPSACILKKCSLSFAGARLELLNYADRTLSPITFHVNPCCTYSANHFLFLLDVVSMD